MRKYYVKYPYGDFVNMYQLVYTEGEDLEAPWIQIGRKMAIRLAKEEKERRKYDPSFSEYADSVIYPYDYDRKNDIRKDARYKKSNHMWLRKV